MIKRILILVLIVFLIPDCVYAFGKKMESNPYQYSKTINSTKEVLNELNDKEPYNFLDLMRMSEEYRKSGEYYDALDCYNQMLEITPKNAGLYGARGLLNMEYINNYNDAVIDYTNAIKYDPNNADYYSFRGMARMKIGDKDGALADLTKAINLNNKAGKKDSFSYCTRALVNSMLGNFNSAIIDATEAIKIKPKYPEAFHFRGLAKMSLALKQLSLQTMDSSIQDLNYAKEQCLQAGNMELYYQVLESYKRALTSKQVIEREIELRKQ